MPNGGLEYRSKEEWQKWEEPLIILDKNIKEFKKYADLAKRCGIIIIGLNDFITGEIRSG